MTINLSLAVAFLQGTVCVVVPAPDSATWAQDLDQLMLLSKQRTPISPDLTYGVTQRRKPLHILKLTRIFHSM